MTVLFLFIIGSVFGSFLNVVIDRLSTGRSIFVGRSYCESCKRKIGPLDLIPVVSYLVLGGRCRYCKSKIPKRTLVVEVLTGLIFSLIYLFAPVLGLSAVELVIALIISLPFIAIFFADLDYGVIPDQLTAFIIIVALSYLSIFAPQDLFIHLIAGIVTLAFFFLIFLMTSGRGMGFGDIKLSFALGLFLGYPTTIISIYLAFLTGAVVGIILIIVGKKRLKKDTIAFGPFLALSAFLSYLCGGLIIDWIVRYFNI